MEVTALNRNNKYIEALATIGVIIGVAIAAVTLWNTYETYFWRPKVTVLDVDFVNAVCHLTINGEAMTLYGSSVVNAGGSWGIQFGTTLNNSGNQQYDTVELINNNMVYEYLTPPAASTTSTTTVQAT